MKTVYVCEDSVSGIFSAIYDAWKSGKEQGECGIALKGWMEQKLFCEYVQVHENEKKVRAVERLIQKYLGTVVYKDIYYAMLSCDCQKADAILGMMLAAKHVPDSTRIMDHLSHPKVHKAFELSRTVGSEAHQFIEFLRFQELKNGILYAEITPKNRILTCVAPHFADRLPLENWIIYDKTNLEFAVHEERKRWVLLKGEEIDTELLHQVSDKELKYEELWKDFFCSIAIESRKNTQCQMNHLPLRFRTDMTEFKEIKEERQMKDSRLVFDNLQKTC